MITTCPNCPSERLVILDAAKKTEAVIGMGDGSTDVSTHAQLDERMDDTVLDNCQCLDCGYEFDCRRSGLKQRVNNSLQHRNH